MSVDERYEHFSAFLEKQNELCKYGNVIQAVR